MRIHRAGISIINWATGLVITVNLLNWFLINNQILKFLIIAGTLIIYILIIQFFRYPEREITIQDNKILSPADGKICVISENTEKEYLNTKCKQVSIFMSPLNVHINWIPIAGEITYLKHKNGEFYAAFKDKSAEENERTVTGIKLNNGQEIVVKQVAGAMARRIINFIEKGQKVTQTDELGFIRFGSRVDLYLPLDAEIKVNLEDKVVGSQTVIAELKA